MPGDGTGRDHDTDPLAATDVSDGEPTAADAPANGKKKRVVHVGDVLGRYELVEDVGEGGMATVYRARDRELRREVAVKVLFPHLARRDEVVRRFHREARAAASLEHANILRIYDVGGAEADDPPYIVMELIRGRSLLAELEQRGPMLAEIVACIGALLADALAVAHAAGIIHRDIKPANILVAPGRPGESGGRLLLADFGVARLETEDSLVTKTGALLGTPAYMSPEQATGDTATAKSDLYSLGATLYQLATGVLPYSGSPAKVMAQLAQGAAQPAVRRRAAVGADLSRAIEKMMKVEPSARPASAAEVAAELRAIAAASGFGDPADEVAAYFGDPDAFVKARTPAIVGALVATARKAISERKLPRAMALADRASALAPEDPAVTTLVDAVTRGESVTRRKKLALVAAAGLAIAGGGAFGVMQLRGGPAAAADGAVAGSAAAMNGSSLDGAPMNGGSHDAAIAVPMLVDAGAIATSVDAATARDAGTSALAVRTRRDAGARDANVAIDAVAMAVLPPDAAPPDAPPPPAPGRIAIQTDAWCNVSIDGTPRGRNTSAPFDVPAGTHTVDCAQNEDRRWTRKVTVAPGQTITAAGSLLGTVTVKLDLDCTILGTSYRKGMTAQLPGGHYEVICGAAKKYVTFRQPCTLRGPDLDCYP